MRRPGRPGRSRWSGTSPRATTAPRSAGRSRSRCWRGGRGAPRRDGARAARGPRRDRAGRRARCSSTRRGRAVTADRRTAPLAARRRVRRRRADAVRLRELPFLAQVGVLRLRRPQRRAGSRGPVGGRGRARLPAAGRAEHRRRRRRHADALWLGPDEWLVVGRPAREARARGELRRGARARLGSVVDLSANRTALELAGPRARDVLGEGLRARPPPARVRAGPLRADAARPRAGRPRAARRRAAPTALLVRSSFAAYVATWLLDAAEEFSSARAERRPAPALGPRHLVERVEVQAGDPGRRDRRRAARARAAARRAGTGA